MSIATERSPRFRNEPTRQPALQAVAALTIALLASLMLVGIVGPWTAVAFFAIGAGAGYSLSGSV